METGILDDGINNLSTLLPNVASEYSENSVVAIPFTRIDSEADLSWLPKIGSVYSEASESTSINASVRIEQDTNVHLSSVPIEECPRCFTVLVPVQFTVNVFTAVMKTTCHCGLSIEIDPKLAVCTTKSNSCKKESK